MGKFSCIFAIVLFFIINLKAYPLSFSKWLLENEIISHVIIASSDSAKSIIVLENNIVGKLDYINISIPKKQFIKRKSKLDTIHNDYRKAEYYLSEAIHPVFPIINDSVYVFKKWFSEKEKILYTEFEFHEKSEEVLKFPLSKIKRLHYLMNTYYEMEDEILKKKNNEEDLLKEKLDVWDSLIINQAELYINDEKEYQEKKKKDRIYSKVFTYSMIGFVAGCAVGVALLFVF